MEFLSRPENPCKRNCPYRDAYCRVDCDDYKEYEEKYKEYTDARRKKQIAEGDYIMYRKELDQRFKKNKFRRKRR